MCRRPRWIPRTGCSPRTRRRQGRSRRWRGRGVSSSAYLLFDDETSGFVSIMCPPRLLPFLLYPSCSMRGGAKVVIEPHRHPGVFVARGKEDALVTLNLNPGKAVYGEKLIKVDVSDVRQAVLWCKLWARPSPFRPWRATASAVAAVLSAAASIVLQPQCD